MNILSGEHGRPEELRPELASPKPAISGLEFQFLPIRIHCIVLEIRVFLGSIRFSGSYSSSGAVYNLQFERGIHFVDPLIKGQSLPNPNSLCSDSVSSKMYSFFSSPSTISKNFQHCGWMNCDLIDFNHVHGDLWGFLFVRIWIPVSHGTFAWKIGESNIYRTYRLKLLLKNEFFCEWYAILTRQSSLGFIGKL